MTTRLRAACGLALLALLPGAAATAAPAERAAGGTLVLQRIDELRRRDFTGGDQRPVFDAPGLVCRFGIKLPDGMQVVDVEEPSAVAAADSTGRDLAQLPPTRFGQPRRVEVVHVYGEAPEALKFRLALPKRQAASFDLSATVRVLTQRGTRDVSAAVGEDWRPLDPGWFGGETAEARLTRDGGSLGLAIRPGTVRAAVESVTLVAGGRELRSGSSMWNDDEITYFFQGRPGPAMQAKLTLRTGLRTIPLRIDVREQPLP